MAVRSAPSRGPCPVVPSPSSSSSFAGRVLTKPTDPRTQQKRAHEQVVVHWSNPSMNVVVTVYGVGLNIDNAAELE